MTTYPHIQRQLSKDAFNAFLQLVGAVENYLNGIIQAEILDEEFNDIMSKNRSLIQFFKSDPILNEAHEELMENIDMFDEDEVQRELYGYVDSETLITSAKKFLSAVDTFNKK